MRFGLRYGTSRILLGLRVRLASADADGVITLSDDWISILSHHTQVAIFQVEVNFLARAGFEMDALKSAKSNERRAFHGRELEIELHDFIACDFAGIGYRHIGAYRLSRRHRLRREH